MHPPTDQLRSPFAVFSGSSSGGPSLSISLCLSLLSHCSSVGTAYLIGQLEQAISLFNLRMNVSGCVPSSIIHVAYSLRHPRGSAVMQASASLSGLYFFSCPNTYPCAPQVSLTFPLPLVSRMGPKLCGLYRSLQRGPASLMVGAVSAGRGQHPDIVLPQASLGVDFR